MELGLRFCGRRLLRTGLVCDGEQDNFVCRAGPSRSSGRSRSPVRYPLCDSGVLQWTDRCDRTHGTDGSNRKHRTDRGHGVNRKYWTNGTHRRSFYCHRSNGKYRTHGSHVHRHRTDRQYRSYGSNQYSHRTYRDHRTHWSSVHGYWTHGRNVHRDWTDRDHRTDGEHRTDRSNLHCDGSNGHYGTHWRHIHGDRTHRCNRCNGSYWSNGSYRTDRSCASRGNSELRSDYRVSHHGSSVQFNSLLRCRCFDYDHGQPRADYGLRRCERHKCSIQWTARNLSRRYRYCWKHVHSRDPAWKSGVL